MNTLSIDSSHIESFQAPYELVKTMRASVLVLGPLVARFGEAHVSLPGGCAIGQRPIDLHLSALEKMGARITLDGGDVIASADRLTGSEIFFDKVTVTGTENIMMAATLAQGTTILNNCAREPEITDLADLLILMGAHIEGAGTGTITIHGVESLAGAEHSVIPDRIETGTFMAAAAITRGDLEITHCRPGHLLAVIDKLRENGIDINQADESTLHVKGTDQMKSSDVTTLPYPGFPTDMQAQYMTLMTQATGISVITETIFENRFIHASELLRMGARIRISGNQAIVEGNGELKGARVLASDLRASASLVLAGLASEGETIIDRVYHIDRGYEKIEKKLCSIGAEIERIRE
jgi:UDP-N-acetylglucosamine 1-carboxyvinyltransferase